MTKIKTFKSGAWTVFERLMPSGMYKVKLYSPSGNLLDRIMCDSYREALAYLRCVQGVAKNY